MTEKKAERILCAMASGAPEYGEKVGEFEAIIPKDATLPEGFALDVLTVLEGEDDTGSAVRYYRDHGDDTQSFGPGVITAVMVIAAALFLLGSHIKFERDKEGKIYFKYEHKPADSELLVKVADALKEIFKSE